MFLHRRTSRRTPGRATSAAASPGGRTPFRTGAPTSCASSAGTAARSRARSRRPGDHADRRAIARHACPRRPGGRAARRALDRLLTADDLAGGHPVHRHHAAGAPLPRPRRPGGAGPPTREGGSRVTNQADQQTDDQVLDILGPSWWAMTPPQRAAYGPRLQDPYFTALAAFASGD